MNLDHCTETQKRAYALLTTGSYTVAELGVKLSVSDTWAAAVIAKLEQRGCRLVKQPIPRVAGQIGRSMNRYTIQTEAQS